jgi:hypothetical protein
MKFTPIILCFCIAASLSTNAATVSFDLGGLTTPTGAATNGGDTRQFAYTTGGGELTITYTLDISMDGVISLANAYPFDNLFRRPGSGGQLPSSGGNMVANENLTITLDSIVANAGWTLDSFAKTNSVTIGGDSRNGSEVATFSVNGGTAFDINGLGTSGNNAHTDIRFTAFDSATDSLSFTTKAGNSGKLNLSGLAFTADVSAIPEPSSFALLAGTLGLFIMLRRRQ